MRFLNSTSGGGKRTTAAGEAFKARIAAKSGQPAEDFNKKLEKRISVAVDEYVHLRKRSAKMRGEADKQIEVSDKTKKMLQILETQKLQKEMKAEKKQLMAIEHAKKQAKQAEQAARTLFKSQEDMKAKNLLEEQQRIAADQVSQKSYFFGYDDQT